MNTKEYNWEEYSSKVDFECKLKGHTPNFGYISASKRAKFVQFLVKNDFLSYKGLFQDLVKIANRSSSGPNIKGVGHYLELYQVENTFTYEALDAVAPSGYVSAYRAKKQTAAQGHRFVTDKSHRLIDMGRQTRN